MIKRCPDCLNAAQIHTDYPTSFAESLLKSLGIIEVKRCSNCNAAVYVVLGFYITSRRKLKVTRERTFWFLFLFLLMFVGFLVYKSIID